MNRKEKIQHLVRRYGIEELIHFTRLENLSGIRRHGLLSVKSLERKGLPVMRNDRARLDGRRRAISLSIECPNVDLFTGMRYRAGGPNSDWAVLIFDASVLWELECGFCPTNAASVGVRNIRWRTLRRSRRLAAILNPDLVSHSIADGRASYVPAVNQAEVLVRDRIPMSFLRGVVVRRPAAAAVLRRSNPGLSVTADGEYFFAGMKARDWRRPDDRPKA